MSDCVEWTGPTNGYGYGHCPKWHGERLAHRVAYERATGVPPGEKHVLHSCDNRLCVNPNHLFLGTNKDNMNDRDAKNRNAYGSRIGNAKLKETDVIDIRAALAASEPQAHIARRYGVSKSTVHLISKGKTWAHT